MGAVPPGGLLDPRTIQDPYPFLGWLREHAPVWRVPGTDLFLVSTWDLVVDAVARVDDFSSNLHALVYTADDGAPALFDMTPLGTNIQTLATADPPTHTVHRRVVFPSLVERRMAGVEPLVRTVASDLVAEWAAGSGEIAVGLANPLPMTVIAHVLGLGDADLDQLLAWAFDGTALLAGTNSLATMHDLTTRTASASAFLAARLAEATPDPESGVIGAVARGVVDGSLDPAEAVSTLVILLGAGGESTTSLIGNAVRTLAEQPDVQAVVRDDASLVAPFVEEVLRLESPFRGHFRTVRRPAELGDVELPPGATLFLLWSSANRDATRFPDPDAVRLDRPHARDHLGFGRGIHHCVGAPLARLEARVALETLLDRTRRLALDPRHPPRYVASMFVRRHAHLHVRDSRGGRASASRATPGPGARTR